VEAVLSAKASMRLGSGPSRGGEFLRAPLEEFFKTLPTRSNEHTTGCIANVLEGVDRVFRHEHDTSAIHVVPSALTQEGHFCPLEQRKLCLHSRGRATDWRSSLGSKTQLSSGLRPAKIDDKLFMECIQSVALLGEDDDISSFVAHVSRDNYAGHTTRVAKSRRTLNP
jgi:hypothetical protein